MMTTRQSSAKQESQTVVRRERLPAELSQVNLNAAGIDVGASSHFVAGVRRPRGAAGTGVRRLHGGPVPVGGLVGPMRGGDRGHGVDGSVLDTPVRSAGRTGLPGDAGGPAAYQERVRPQDRRAGLPVAPATAHLRTAVGSLPARRGHPASAQLPAAAGHAGGVCVPSYPAHAEGTDPDERQAPARHQQHHRQDRDGHHRGHCERRTGPPQAGPVSSPWHESGPRHDSQVVAGALAGGAHLRVDPGPGAVPVLSG